MSELAQLLREAKTYMQRSDPDFAARLDTAAAELEEQEPVAWCFTDVNGKPKELCGHPKHRAEQDLRVYTPLYLAQATSVVSEGWKLVPVDLTDAMLDARITALESALRGCVTHMKTAGSPKAVRACEAAERVLSDA